MALQKTQKLSCVNSFVPFENKFWFLLAEPMICAVANSHEHHRIQTKLLHSAKFNLRYKESIPLFSKRRWLQILNSSTVALGQIWLLECMWMMNSISKYEFDTTSACELKIRILPTGRMCPIDEFVFYILIPTLHYFLHVLNFVIWFKIVCLGAFLKLS